MRISKSERIHLRSSSNPFGSKILVNGEDHKKYTIQARIGIKGEAFFEALIADYSLPHHVVGPKDIGIDYNCEWVYGEAPTGVLFAAQVKTFTVENANKPELKGTEVLNGLEKYVIRNSHLKVDERTLRYWKGLGLPMYLFVVARTKASGQSEDDVLDCYYKRFTPVLTMEEKQEGLWFYKVNRGLKFIAFAKNPVGQGFALDLFIALMRWSYYKGNIAYVNPRMLGLTQFPEEGTVFPELFRDYKERICDTYSKVKQFLDIHCG